MNLFNHNSRCYSCLLPLFSFVIVHIICLFWCIFLIPLVSFKLLFVKSTIRPCMPFTVTVEAISWVRRLPSFWHRRFAILHLEVDLVDHWMWKCVQLQTWHLQVVQQWALPVNVGNCIMNQQFPSGIIQCCCTSFSIKCAFHSNLP